MLMLTTSRQCAIRAQQIRTFSTTLSINAAAAANTPATQTPSTKPISDATASHKPTGMDKRYLVWSGKYKSTADIPEYVHKEAMERANNKVRIRGANIMMVLTVIGCIVMVMSGKEAAKGGASVVQQNLDWHKAYNEAAKDGPASTK